MFFGSVVSGILLLVLAVLVLVKEHKDGALSYALKEI